MSTPTTPPKTPRLRVTDANVRRVARALGRFLDAHVGGDWEHDLQEAAKAAVIPGYEMECDR
jgi:hypothetical protein